jgi:hypothetical protein
MCLEVRRPRLVVTIKRRRSESSRTYRNLRKVCQQLGYSIRRLSHGRMHLPAVQDLLLQSHTVIAELHTVPVLGELQILRHRIDELIQTAVVLQHRRDERFGHLRSRLLFRKIRERLAAVERFENLLEELEQIAGRDEESHDRGLACWLETLRGVV